MNETLVEQLRTKFWSTATLSGAENVRAMCLKGADTIESLQAINAELLAALEGTQSALEEAGATAVLEDVRAVIAKARE